MAGIYLHIPFCRTRCIYCGFYSQTGMQLARPYTDALLLEMRRRRSFLPSGEQVSTIYLGGGTPSQLPTHELERILDALYREFDVAPDAEVTMECNPDDVTEDFCQWLSSQPVNRVSMGVQTFSDERLRFLCRRHDAQGARDAFRRLRDCGIGNISIDLMFGFPGQTLSEWQDDIDCAVGLHPEHISAYSLMYEEGTTLYNMLLQGRVSQCDEELSRSMYYTLRESLLRARYDHYEISNFAKPDLRSRHNSSYWHGVPYLGLGAAAHSYDGHNLRSWNIEDIHAYIDGIAAGTSVSDAEHLDLPTLYNDAVMTALRTREGISVGSVLQRFGPELHRYLLDNAASHIDAGRLHITEDRLHLSADGLYVSDDIMSDLMYVE